MMPCMDQNRITTIANARAFAASGVARALRRASFLSLRDVAAEVGVAPSTVHAWETGKKVPSQENAARYGRLLTTLLQVEQIAGEGR